MNSPAPVDHTRAVKIGRPTDYRPEYCERVMELGREGKSRAQIARDLDCDRATLFRWADETPAFRNALDRARELELAWWEDQGQIGLFDLPEGKRFNANAFKFQVINRFRDDYIGETSTSELSGPGGQPLMPQINIMIAMPGAEPQPARLSTNEAKSLEYKDDGATGE